jgi:hypothetical protein
MPPKSSAVQKSPVDLVTTAYQAQQEQYTAGLADFELPKTNVIKLAKGSVSDTQAVLF